MFKRIDLPLTPPDYQPPSPEERAKLRESARAYASKAAAGLPATRAALEGKRKVAAERKAAAVERKPELAAKLAEQEKAVKAKLDELRKPKLPPPPQAL